MAPQIIHFKRVFHHKPSILEYPYFRKHPYKPYHFHKTLHEVCEKSEASRAPDGIQTPDVWEFKPQMLNVWKFLPTFPINLGYNVGQYTIH